MTALFKLRALAVGIVLAGTLAFAAAAQEAKSTGASQSDQDMTIGEAADNFVEDAGKVGEKAEEVGSDIVEGAEDAYESTKKAVQDATE